ncbi:diguanylate cyclase domain-containing protein [Leptolyngbya sp. AN02str]|uniref:diguanylate cyclase domain-containing protein n=1 Tax=Leptolyngbya sp. AN02str TaxID=3423363 RepID=UPI003D312F7B
MYADSRLLNTIPGYRLSQQVFFSPKFAVYRAVCETDQCSVEIKFLNREYASFTDILQFRNQYMIAKLVQHKGIIQVYSLESHPCGYALIMEDFSGICLQKYMQTRSLQPSEVLKIALQLADILDALHQHRVIHKDIKPVNILIQPETNQVKLVDFAIASLLPQETQELQSPNVLEGTLAYISPEQTGRMNRGIDYRTDFYSLGITLYTLLTGQLPFQAEDPIELVHQHLAQQPIAPHRIRPEISPILSNLVLKLMAKNAEDRYQSASGLKYDLESCLAQMQDALRMTPFELGARDRSDRFMISEKLYGRDAEVERLLSAFDRVSQGNTEMMLITGFSGIGKTAVVNEIHKPIVKHHGYFIAGKFDQVQRNIPFYALVQAFRDLIRQLLSEPDQQLIQWKTQILQALGENTQVMIEIIPELEQIVGQQPPASKLSGNATQNRFNLVFQKFVQIFANPEHPLVLFADDLQWADPDSLQLMQLLLTNSDTHCLLFIGSYRDHEVDDSHPLLHTLNTLMQGHLPIHRIVLAPLSKLNLNSFVADTLGCTTATASPLTDLIYPKTQGNPFFSIQFLKTLHDDGLITFDPQQRCWQCALTSIKARALTDNVLELMALRLRKLPIETQQVLKLAACIGNQFDLETLTLISQQSSSSTAAALWKALQSEFIVPTNEVYKIYQVHREPILDLEHQPSAAQQSIHPETPTVFPGYKFLHDRIQQAVYTLIPDSEKQAIHLTISQRLLSSISKAELEEKIFDIVNRLNYGVELITAPQEREQLVELNFMAGRRAKATTAYAAAIEYLAIAIRLLPHNTWKANYRLTLALYEEAIEAAYLCGDFRQMEAWKTILLSKAVDILDQVKTYEIQIVAFIAQNQLQEAIATALAVLHELGIHFPTCPTPEDWQQAIAEVRSNLAGKTVASAIDLPPMTHPQSQVALRLLLSIDAPTYMIFPDLLPLTICKQVNLSLTFGNLPSSAKAYANYGLLLCSGLGDLDVGYEFGQLALRVLDALPAKEIFARTSFLVNFLIRHWKEPLRDTLPSLQEAYDMGLKTGDLLHATIAAEKYCYHAYFAGESLPNLAETMEMYAEKMVQMKQDVALCTHQIHWQAVLNLMGKSQNPCCLIGQACDETSALPTFIERNARTALYYIHFNKLLLCYLFYDYEQAIVQAELAEQYLDGSYGQYISSLFYYYEALARLAIYPNSSFEEQEAILEKVAAHQNKMQHWANYAPTNFQHKYDLVAAEMYRILGKKVSAIEHYDAAIEGAKANNYIQEAALANELAATFYLNWGKTKIAQLYLLDAYRCYTHWGAKAKTNELEVRYPHLLKSQQKHHSLDPLEAIAPSFEPDEVHQSISIATPDSDALDCAAILKAFQVLSSEIYLDKLLVTLIKMVIANAGASKCALILLYHSDLYIEAVAQLGQEPKILQSIPIDESTDIPIRLLYKAKRSLETITIDNVSKEVSLLTDSYLVQQQPKSLLCMPILNQGKLIGILYLENQHAAGAFTKDRVEILNLLCCQAAISLQNARLYEQAQGYSHQLELKVSERTAELEKANQELYRIATLDGLTQIFNRRYFDTYLKEQWQQLLLVRQPLSLLLCDIDYFKRYNDYYGHQAGDECLKQVAQLLSQIVKRPNDVVARYGGEEFAVVLPYINQQGAGQVAERIGVETRHRRIPHAESHIAPYITLSIGVSSLVPHADMSYEALITTADQALYQAKKAGRNRFCTYHD